MNYENSIEINQAIRFGKPCIAGTRITVQDILEMLAGGMTTDEIIVEFPQLTVEKIRAALSFAASRERMVKMVAA